MCVCHKSTYLLTCLLSMLWHCWLGGRKGIRPVKNWVVGCWHGYLSGARCRLAYGPADATATHRLFASVKSRLVLPFWYRLTWVVPDKGPLNGCVCVLLTYLLCLPGDLQHAVENVKPETASGNCRQVLRSHGGLLLAFSRTRTLQLSTAYPLRR